MKSIMRILLKILGVILVLLILFGIYAWYGNPSDRPIEKTMGLDPELVDPEARSIPSIALADPIGWDAGAKPDAAEGLTVSRFAEGLDHPRTMLTLPNGDVLVALTNAPPRNLPGGITGFFMKTMMNWVGAGGTSPNRIALLRDEDGDGTAEKRYDFREDDMSSPSGMAWGNGRLYIANHDAVLSFAFEPGATKLEGKPEKLMDLPPGGNHWMRNLILSPDAKKLYVAVGSASNIAENGLEEEKGRAAIWEIDLASKRPRQYAGGMRNANGMAWNPSTGELWATVQERDMLGPDLVPDYLTNVPVGAHYGWPWIYWKDIFDTRVDNPMPMYQLEYTRKPEFALGAHTAALGLVFSTGNRMGDGYGNGAFIARHGSWNRKPPVGYDVIFVPFDERGNPLDGAKTVLSGFLKKGGGETHGRPTWLAWDKDGALLVSDDTAGIIWRVIAPKSKLSQAPSPVVADSMPAQRELSGDPDAKFIGRITNDYVVEE